MSSKQALAIVAVPPPKYSTTATPLHLTLQKSDKATDKATKLIDDQEALDDWISDRRLALPFADSKSIWGLIVGISIAGVFCHYNAGFQYGFGSMIIANILSTILCLLVSISLTELGTAFPFASGCLSYGKAAFGCLFYLTKRPLLLS